MKVGQRTLFLWIFLIAMWEFPGSFGDEDCLKNHNLTSADLEEVNPSTPVSAVPINIKCYSRCVIDEYFGEDGKIDLERVGNRGTEQEKIVLAQCKQQFDDVTDLGRCDYPYLMLQCFYLGKRSGTIAQ
ncbi:uncharacterized protein LOC108094402 [Drosophila ficusphila]|uniref:uncharacterized protein LOC108094402 n=1 Tax=Drosophila ficusphila TaxID=30025 RepID=UPI0007E66060|nr:uncharacterized protein LOC108094402 [Drosophila ficusphila]